MTAHPHTAPDLSRCRQCAHGHTGPSTGLLYCRAGPPGAFAHQMRQQAAPCGPTAFLFVPAEVQR